MTAAAEDDRSPLPADGKDRHVRRRWLVAALIGVSLAGGTACTADAVNVPAAMVGGTGPPGLITTELSGVPAADEAAIRGVIDKMNSAAAQGVAAQQEMLAAQVQPQLANALDDCAPATTTLRFEPIYPGLRPSPGWTGKSGPLTGTVFALPTLIRIHTGDRITGTDLTTLHFGVQAGEAYLTPLCVS